MVWVRDGLLRPVHLPAQKGSQKPPRRFLYADVKRPALDFKSNLSDRQRGTAAQRGYCSARWRKVRASKLQIDPLCSQCGRIAEHVDHLRAVDGPDDPRFWLWANLDSKCASCHSRKTIAMDGGFRR